MNKRSGSIDLKWGRFAHNGAFGDRELLQSLSLRSMYAAVYKLKSYLSENKNKNAVNGHETRTCRVLTWSRTKTQKLNHRWILRHHPMWSKWIGAFGHRFVYLFHCEKTVMIMVKKIEVKYEIPPSTLSHFVLTVNSTYHHGCNILSCRIVVITVVTFSST